MSTILIIDDDSAIRQMLFHVLRGNGHRVFEAENGEIGIQMAHELTPDIILCDAVMPKLSGIEAVSIMHQLPATREIPIVMMSGSIPEDQLKEALSLGAVDYLPKPFTLNELRDCLTRAMQSRQSAYIATSS